MHVTCNFGVRRVGMVFMPNDDASEALSKKIYEEVLSKEGLKLLAWRAVPVKPEVVGRFAKATQPRIWQVLVEGKAGLTGDDLERELFIVRKLVESERNKRLPADKVKPRGCGLQQLTVACQA